MKRNHVAGLVLALCLGFVSLCATTDVAFADSDDEVAEGGARRPRIPHACEQLRVVGRREATRPDRRVELHERDVDRLRHRLDEIDDRPGRLARVLLHAAAAVEQDTQIQRDA